MRFPNVLHALCSPTSSGPTTGHDRVASCQRTHPQPFIHHTIYHNNIMYRGRTTRARTTTTTSTRWSNVVEMTLSSLNQTIHDRRYHTLSGSSVLSDWWRRITRVRYLNVCYASCRRTVSGATTGHGRVACYSPSSLRPLLYYCSLLEKIYARSFTCRLNISPMECQPVVTGLSAASDLVVNQSMHHLSYTCVNVYTFSKRFPRVV